MPTLFISDLHLHSSRPSITKRFLEFVEDMTASKNCEALFILGDFFEVWLGDDHHDPHDDQVIEALAKLTRTGIPVYLMRGNRDFLIGDGFAKASGCKLIPDPFVIELYGKRILLTHGDSLCTLDIAHQRFRKIIQNPFVQWAFLKLPLIIRQKIAKKIRTKSGRSLQKEWSKLISGDRFDVTKEAVLSALKKHQTTLLIHGHTHKPGIHEFNLGDNSAKRIVLGEWGTLGNVLEYSEEALELKSI